MCERGGGGSVCEKWGGGGSVTAVCVTLCGAL